MDTKEHGIPQSRKRIYFVGISKLHDDGSFSFPDLVAQPSIELFLESQGVDKWYEADCRQFVRP